MASEKVFSLSSQLIKQVILPLILVVSLLSAWQLYLLYQSGINSARQHLDDQLNQILPVLSKALYDADHETIQLIGDSLYHDPHVEYLMISDQFSRLYMRNRSRNTPLPELAPIELSKPVSYTNNRGQRLLLGNISIHFNQQSLLTGLTHNSLLLATIGIVKIVLPMFVLLIFLNRKIQRRLADLIDAMGGSSPDHFEPAATQKSDPEEIRSLIHAFNDLQHNNYRYHHHQQEAHQKLLQRNKEVAEGQDSARMLTSMLQNSQKRYRALFHRNIDALLIVEHYRPDSEEHFRIIDANQAAVNLLSQPLELLIKQDFISLFGMKPLDLGHCRLDTTRLPPVLQQTNIQIELHFNRVMYDKQGLYYVTLRDISDKIRAEQLEKEAHELMNFRQNQMAIAEIATTIAHEINQPLAAIQNYALSAINFSNQERFNPEKLRKSLEQLMEQADIASGIVQQARGQLGRNDYPQQQLDLTELVRKSIDLCRIKAEKHQVQLLFDPGKDSAPVIANDIQIKQLMINIITNAVEALAEAGTAQGYIQITLSRNAPYHEIRIQDNGAGMADSSQVFTTHYSTKENGLGMGLAICRSIIEIHHGSISAENRATGGAEFIIRLPAAGEPPEKLLKRPDRPKDIVHSTSGNTL